MTAAIRLLGFLFALAGMTALEAQSRPAVQLALSSAELAEGEALRVWVKAEGLSGQRVVLADGATLLAAGELSLRGEAELVVRNLAPGRRHILARLPQRMELRSDVVAVQIQGRRRVQEPIEIDGALATAAFDADLDGRMDLLVATRDELLLLIARLDGNYEPTVKLARWPQSISAITNLLPGDWNGDGRWDVLLGTDTGVELWVAGKQGLERKFRETGYRHPMEADENGDGVPDVLVEKTAAGGKTEPWVWTGTGAGSFVPGQRQPVEARAAERSGGEWRGGVIAAGVLHSLRLKSDGTVWAWGANYQGQLGDGTTTQRFTPVLVGGLTGVVAIASGAEHSLALKSDGTVWAWGNNFGGRLGDGTTTDRWSPVLVNGLTGVVAIAGGELHSLALKSDGTVWAWGTNSSGQLGDGSTLNRLTPVPVSGLSEVAAIAGGSGHSLAVKSNGTVWEWGGSTNLTPVQVGELTGVVGVAAGSAFSLAMKSDGTVWAWGNNSSGQLGDGSTTYRTTPLPVTGLTGVAAIAAGYRHSLALKSDGTVRAWGYNGNGQLGDGTTTNSATPVQVTGLTGVLAIAGGSEHSLALKSDGTAWGWGWNLAGILGDGTETTRTTPVPVSGLAVVGFTAIAAGGYHSLAAKSDGSVWAWGANAAGQVGDGSTSNRLTPVPVSGLTGVVAVAAGDAHSLALKSDGTVWAWGLNGYGQLGDGSMSPRLTPVPVGALTGVVAIAVGGYHSLALKSDGTVWAWGLNDFGQLGDGSALNRSTPVPVSGLTGVTAIAGGYSHSLALKSDGTAWGWGRNTFGQLGDGTTTDHPTPITVSGLTGAVAIAGGSFHSLALKSDGTAWGWGNNSYAQLGDGTGTQRVTPVLVSGLTGLVAIAGGQYHSLAVKSDGTAWAWGLNQTGQLGDGSFGTLRMTPVPVSGLTGMVAIDGGADHSLALKSDGTVWGTGSNNYGQLGDGTTLARLTPVAVSVPEAVSAPNTPSGTAAGTTGVSSSYSTGGALSSLGHAVQYQFDWGDGTTSGWLAAGVTSASHSWASAGSYTVRAMARCAAHTAVESGWSAGLTVAINVTETVSAPATPTGTASATTGVSYSYSIGGAISSWGDSLQYYVDWGDGTTSGWLGAGVTSVSHSFASTGSYTVKTMARCATHNSVQSGWSGGLTVTVNVPETISAPTTPSGTASATTGVSYTYSTGGAISNLGHPVQYVFDWGDGTNSGWLAAGGTSASHSWSSAGSYTVKAMARCTTDTSAQSGWSAGVTVTLSAPPETVSAPATPSGPASGPAGLSYSYLTGGAISNWGDPVQYQFDWGDGTTSGWLGAGVTGASHTWVSAGSYTVKAMARCMTHTLVQSGWSGGLTVAQLAVVINQPPLVVGVSPGAGTGGSQAMTFTFTDPDGWQDLGVVNILVNFWLDGRNACYLAYSRPGNTLYLVNNAGDGYAGSMLLSGSGSLGNSQCTISGAGSSVSGTGSTMNLTLNMTFPTSFAGTRIIYLAARDSIENNSGWQRMGVWKVPGAAQTTTTAVAGMNPARGSGTGGTFTYTFTDTSGANDLGVMNILVNDWLDGRHACYLAYARGNNTLYLMNDNGDTLLPGKVLDGTGSLGNSQCTVNGVGSSATPSGNTLTLTLNMMFGGGVAGNRVFYLAARDVNELNNTGWQATGSWTVQ